MVSLGSDLVTRLDTLEQVHRIELRRVSAAVERLTDLVEGLIKRDHHRQHESEKEKERTAAGTGALLAPIAKGRRSKRDRSHSNRSMESLAAAESPVSLALPAADSVHHTPPTALPPAPTIPAIENANPGPAKKQRGRSSVEFLFRAKEDATLLMPNTPYRAAMHFALTCFCVLDWADLTMSLSDTGIWKSGTQCAERSTGWVVMTMVYAATECGLSVMEIWMNCRTAVLLDWNFVDNDPQLVFSLYKRRWLLFDAVVAAPIEIPLYFLSTTTAFRVARGIKSLRVFRLFTLFPSVSPVTDRNKFYTGHLFIVHCALAVIFCALLWLVIAETDEIFGGLDGVDKFTLSVYFVITTLTSVGYGDVSPTSTGAQWYCMVLQCIGVLFIVYTGAVGTAFILETDPHKMAVADRKRRLASLMEHNKIPLWLQKQCFVLLPSLLDSSLRDYKVILNEMPPFIQDRIIQCIKAELIRSVPLFRGATPSVLASLVESLRSHIIPPREFVIEYGDRGCEMFFISNGTVEVTVPDEDGKESWVATLSDGSWFGEVALLCETERTANVRAVSPCVLYVLDKSSFLSIVRSCPDFEASIKSELSRRNGPVTAAEELQSSGGRDIYGSLPPTPRPGSPRLAIIRASISHTRHNRKSHVSSESSVPTTWNGELRQSTAGVSEDGEHSSDSASSHNNGSDGTRNASGTGLHAGRRTKRRPMTLMLDAMDGAMDQPPTRRKGTILCDRIEVDSAAHFADWSASAALATLEAQDDIPDAWETTESHGGLRPSASQGSFCWQPRHRQASTSSLWYTSGSPSARSLRNITGRGTTVRAAPLSPKSARQQCTTAPPPVRQSLARSMTSPGSPRMLAIG
eukprot:TRINITY_DN2660_c0_g1_i1.p1 TRINITY_DN2660_c0_g1~~TRINITY_DN2660_c0_g1_i1.p1  ORF type:complete len:859 (+),score=128.12 TRINITY_DN2660_c0_g1_i1:77-2653(+)